MVRDFIKSNYLKVIERNKSIVIFNSLYGNAVELDKKDSISKLFLERDHFSEQDFQTNKGLVKLLRLRHIVDDQDNEKDDLEKLAKERYKLAPTGKLIRNLQLNVSELCNLACKYCIQQRSGRENDRSQEEQFKQMSWETAKLSIDKFISILDQNNNNKGHLMFFGGEPLMNWDVIEKSMYYIAEKYSEFNISYVVTSNGTLITKERAKKLKEHEVTFQVSLDGLKEVNDVNRIFQNSKGTFQAVDKGLRVLSDFGVDINLGVVISDATIHSIDEKFIDYAIDLGVRNIEVNPEETLYKTRNHLEISKKLLDLIEYGIQNKINVFTLMEMPLLKMLYKREGFCSAVGSAISVEPSGDVYLCRCLKEKAKCISEKAGKIYNLQEILEGEYYKNMASRVEGNVIGCNQCDVEGLCGGGCSANAEKLVGNVYERDHTRCEMVRTITYEELKRFGLRKMSKEAKAFAKKQQSSQSSEDETEKQLTKIKFNFWDKDLIRAYLVHKKEKEYVPIRMIDF